MLLLFCFFFLLLFSWIHTFIKFFVFHFLLLFWSNFFLYITNFTWKRKRKFLILNFFLKASFCRQFEASPVFFPFYPSFFFFRSPILHLCQASSCCFGVSGKELVRVDSPPPNPERRAKFMMRVQNGNYQPFSLFLLLSAVCAFHGDICLLDCRNVNMPGFLHSSSPQRGFDGRS